MFSEKLYGMAWYAWLSFIMLLAVSCASERRLSEIRLGRMRPDLSMPSDKDFEKEKEKMMREIKVDSLSGDMSDGPLIMNAIKDEETGEMVAVDVINASKVVARFRNVAERAGKVTVEFDVTVPSALVSSRWQLRIFPEMAVGEDSLRLDPVLVTGAGYRSQQMRGYERYREFVSSIIRDSSGFVMVRPLEIFIERNYPGIYAMKNDTSIVPEPMAENLFGVNQKLALEHYTMHERKRRNDWKIKNKDMYFRKFVKSPFVNNVRLDTVMSAGDGSLVYRYTHTMSSSPGLRKMSVSLRGTVFRDGEQVLEMPSPEKLTFYVSSLSSLADDTPRYLFMIIDRVVTDNTDAFLDFDQGSTSLDTLRPGNASELARIRKCFSDVYSRRDMVLDSIIVTASCSPEGSVKFNSGLAGGRALSVKRYVLDRVDGLEDSLVRSESVPENWEYFRTLVANDTVLPPARRDLILKISEEKDKDSAESRLAVMPEYRYLREKIYPRLRTVNFSFHMHRPDVEKDTVHTKVLDTVYMKGLEALKNLDYKVAASLLGPYRDYNAALAMASSGYDDTALSILSELKDAGAKADYLGAVLLARMGEYELAAESFRRSVRKDPSMAHRANLDPELSDIVKKGNYEYGMLLP